VRPFVLRIPLGSAESAVAMLMGVSREEVQELGGIEG